MSRFYRGIQPGRIAIIAFTKKGYDIVETPGYEELEEENPTGIAGVRRLFTTNKYGEPRPEFTTALHLSIMSAIGGAIIGSFLHGRSAWLQFMENNNATAFVSHFDAQQKLRDTVTVSCGKGAWKWGRKIGSFATLFIFSSTVIAAYRGRPGFLEYVAGGALTGAIFKISLGLKAMIAGSVVGAICGAGAGALSLSVLFLSGYTIQDIQKTQSDLKRIRDEHIRLAHAKQYGDGTQDLVKTALAEEKERRIIEENPAIDS